MFRILIEYRCWNTVQRKILAGGNFDELPLFEILTNAPVQ